MLWPDVNTEAGARGAVRAGVWALIWVGFIQFAASVLFRLPGATEAASEMFALTIFFVAGAIAILLATMLTQTHSRIIAWIALLWNLEQIASAVAVTAALRNNDPLSAASSPGYWVFSLLALYGAMQGIRGANAIARRAGPQTSAMSAFKEILRPDVTTESGARTAVKGGVWALGWIGLVNAQVILPYIWFKEDTLPGDTSILSKGGELVFSAMAMPFAFLLVLMLAPTNSRIIAGITLTWTVAEAWRWLLRITEWGTIPVLFTMVFLGVLTAAIWGVRGSIAMVAFTRQRAAEA